VSQSRWNVSACTTTAGRGQSPIGPHTVSMMISASRSRVSNRPTPKNVAGVARYRSSAAFSLA